MILLIADSQPCIARSVLPRKHHEVAYIQSGSPSFTDTLDAVLEQEDLSLAIIECHGKEKACLFLISAIKKRRADVPVLFIASADTFESIAEAFQRGARYCFRSPLNIALFQERMQRILSFKAARREQRIPMFPLDDPREDSPFADRLPAGSLPEGILRALDYIANHLSDRDLTVVRLAGVAGMSPFHFCRIFKKSTLYSPIQFVTRMRIEQAKNMLLHRAASTSISQIAAASGFYDSSDLNRHFKRSTGLTPTQFFRSAASR